MQANYMSERGLQTLAILFSLPYALLMWSWVQFISELTKLEPIKFIRMATFVLSIAITCFDVSGTAQRVVTGIVWLFIVLFVGWTIVTGWIDTWVRTRESDRGAYERQSTEGFAKDIISRLKGIGTNRHSSHGSGLERQNSIPLKAVSIGSREHQIPTADSNYEGQKL
jgi:hypothetical protein